MKKRSITDPLNKLVVEEYAHFRALKIAPSELDESDRSANPFRVGYNRGFSEGVAYALKQIESGKSAVTIASDPRPKKRGTK